MQVIYTDRYFNDWPSWHIIYEWEDVISKSLGLPLADSQAAFVVTKYADKAIRYLSRKLYTSGNRLLPVADRLISKKNGLYFELFSRNSFYFTGSKNTIPVIIDFWKGHDLVTFNSAYKNCRAVLISSIQVYNYLKDNNCPLNIYHFPLSLPDKYRISANTKFKKIYDIVIPGRANPVLLTYLAEYEKKFPNVNYLRRKEINGTLSFISNKSDVIIPVQNREEYIALLRSARVSFYATPGIDGDEQRTGGFSPVTPNFLEMVSAGCRIIARYPKNEETAYYEMSKICISSDSYPIFEQELSAALNNDELDLTENENYLRMHYTSNRAVLLKSILNET